jgi:multisubunit Na+/H+ antiporter MnhC subunit
MPFAGKLVTELGTVESSTYVTPLEQAEVLPAASVAVALNVVVVSSVTETARPGDEKLAAEPVAAVPPVQSFEV